MLRILVRKQLMEIFRSYFYDPKKNRARSKGTVFAYFVLFVLLMAGLLGGMFTMLSMSLCEPLMAVNMDWLYFAIMGLLGILLGVFGSVFNTYSGLYLAKDNDLLLSMPIPVSVLMSARLLTVYLMGLMYSAVILIPAVVVYWISGGFAIASMLGGLSLIVLISLFVLTLSCALGWAVAKISQKLKNRSMITVIVSVLFFAAYYFFYFKAQIMIQELVMHAVMYGEMIISKAYPLYVFGKAGTGDIVSIMVLTAVVLVSGGLVWKIVSGSFLNMATASGNTVRKEYREKPIRQKGVMAALLSREMRHFTASSTYMLNCGLGSLMLVVAGIAIVWKGSDVISAMNMIFWERPGSTAILLCTLVCMLAGMNDMTAPSISLEGKNLWLVQSLPVDSWKVLQAKIYTQLILTGIPALFAFVCLALVYPYTPADLAVTALMIAVYVLCAALFGLVVGVKMPVLHWSSEITPIKQSAGAMIVLFAGMLAPIGICFGYLMMEQEIAVSMYLGIVGLVFLLVSCGMYLWLKYRGTKIVSTL
ncbi:MAG: hypothetical protein ACI32N_00505 [Bulleidia sp.]